MRGHASLEQLSGYLDRELDAHERRSVADHVGECARCRERLRGLRHVVDELDRLREQAPPRHLGRLVERRLDLARPPHGLAARLEERMRRTTGLPALAPLFGVVLALGIILYLFAWAVARWDEGREPRVIAPVESPEPTAEGAVEWRHLAGRAFRLERGVWLERGVEMDTPAERLDAAELGAEARRELSELYRLGGSVRLRLDGRVVEVDAGGLAAAEGSGTPLPPRR